LHTLARRGKRGSRQSPHLALTFEQFDFGFQPSIDEKQIRELRTLRFVQEASNVIRKRVCIPS
jgi:DNA replication protein DnaC